MGNSNRIGEKVNGKKLLRALFALSGFFAFQVIPGKLDSIVREFVMMLPGFFCFYKVEK